MWEADPAAMGVALVAHDEVLRSAVEGRGGWMFKHTGDGVCAAFSSAPEGVAAAIDAQRRLGLPVRMGVVTGSVELSGDDYFGPVLNPAARVMADEFLAAARARGNPSLVAVALLAAGRAFADTDPQRALSVLREGIEYCKDNRLIYAEAAIADCAADLEAVHGDVDKASGLIDFAIGRCLASADYPNMGLALASMVLLFARIEQPDIAGTVYGASTRMPSTRRPWATRDSGASARRAWRDPIR